jgi:hypothetical protein
MAGVLMDIAYMSNGVSQQEFITFFARKGDRFFIKRQCGGATIQVTLDLAQTFECPDKLASCAGFAAERYGFGVIPLSIGWSILQPRATRLCHESYCLGGEIVHGSVKQIQASRCALIAGGTPAVPANHLTLIGSGASFVGKL